MQLSLRRLLTLTAAFAIAAAAAYASRGEWRDAIAILVGAAFSAIGLYLFDRLSHNIAPGPNQKKPWRAGLFMTRYIAIALLVYATVKVLGTGYLPVLLGLLTSTAAVLTAAISDLIASLARTKSQT